MIKEKIHILFQVLLKFEHFKHLN